MEQQPAQGVEPSSERRTSESDDRALVHLTVVAEQQTDTHEHDEEAGDSDNNRESVMVAQSDAASSPMQLSPVAPFVSKAYAIVNGEADGIVSWWESDGEDTFVIKRVDVFQEQVLPRFFSHKNYSSFVRQLNNHGFSRVRSPSSGGGAMGGDGRGARSEQESGWWEFKHSKFRRGNRGLLSDIKRRKEKKRSVSTTSAHPSARVDHADGVPGDPTQEVRGEMEHMRREMHGMNRKLDELKSLVVGMLVYIRDTGVPQAAPPPSPLPGEAHASEAGAGFATGMGHYSQRQQQQQQQQSPPPPPPPPQQRKHQQQEKHQRQQPPQQQQQQEQQQQQHQHQLQQQQQQPPSNQNDEGWHEGGNGPHMQQSRGSNATGRRENVQLHEQPLSPTMAKVCRTKRAREDASPSCPSHPGTHAPQHPSFASSHSVGAGTRVDGGMEPNGNAVGAGSLVGTAATGVVRVGDGGSAYRDSWAGLIPPGNGGGPHGGGLSSWQNRWPDGATDTFYPYHHVPMRMAGYPFPFAGVPMQYAVPASGTTYLSSGPMGTGAAAAAASSNAASVATIPSREVHPHESHMRQSLAMLPLHGVEGALALTLSSLKSGVKEYPPSEAGRHVKDYGEQRDSGSSPSSRGSMGGAPIA